VLVHGTPRSHFTRIVRIVAHELGIACTMNDIGNVGETRAFGGHPLMEVPVLEDGDAQVFGTDHICRISWRRPDTILSA